MYICIICVFTYMNFTFFVSNAIDMLHKVARKKKKKKTLSFSSVPVKAIIASTKSRATGDTVLYSG